MQQSTFFLPAADGAPMFVRHWEPDSTPRGVVQIAHGLAEHSERYARYAQALTDAGFAVYANDHRGHGHTAKPEDIGFFALADGWAKCMADLWSLNRKMAADNPGMPLIFFGHSMGSFMGQRFIAEHGDILAGAILSGSNGRPPAAIAALGGFVARVERARLGPRGKSALLKRMMFGAFSRAFRPNRTAFDWLSRDPREVDAYVADPLCGFDYSTQLVVDLLDALPHLLSPATVQKIAKGLPIYIVSGMRDPVAAQIQDLLDTYRGAGLNPAVHLYPDGRHEMLNEINRDEVTRDILEWLNRIVAKT